MYLTIKSLEETVSNATDEPLYVEFQPSRAEVLGFAEVIIELPTATVVGLVKKEHSNTMAVTLSPPTSNACERVKQGLVDEHILLFVSLPGTEWPYIIKNKTLIKINKPEEATYTITSCTLHADIRLFKL
jgi:hypothetical protein